MIINQYYLKQPLFRSDIIAFFIIIAGYICSFFHIVSKIFNIPIPKHLEYDNPDEASSTLQVSSYNTLINTKDEALEYDVVEIDNP